MEELMEHNFSSGPRNYNLTSWLTIINSTDRAAHLANFALEHVRMYGSSFGLGEFFNSLNDSELTTLNFLLELESARYDIGRIICFINPSFPYFDAAQEFDYFKLVASIVTKARRG
jgi:hypothetical protein